MSREILPERAQSELERVFGEVTITPIGETPSGPAERLSVDCKIIIPQGGSPELSVSGLEGDQETYAKLFRHLASYMLGLSTYCVHTADGRRVTTAEDGTFIVSDKPCGFHR